MIKYSAYSSLLKTVFSRSLPIDHRLTIRTYIGLFLLLCVVAAVLNSVVLYIVCLGLIIGFFARLNRFRWWLFAAENNWDVVGARYQNLPPSVRAVGKNRFLSDMVLLSVEGVQGEMYWYEFDESHRHSRQRHLIARVPLKKHYPHIVINSKHNDGGVQRLQSSLKKVVLEGEYTENYQLYVEREQYQDALMIVYPDVLHVITQQSFHEDIEIDDKSLFFIMTVDERNQAAVESMLKVIGAVSAELVEGIEQLKANRNTTTFLKLMLK